MLRQEVRKSAAILLLLFLYYLAGRAGLALAFVHSSATAVWAPSGIALAAMLVWGRRVWPVILAGAFLVNFSTSGSLAASFMIAVGNTLEALVGAVLVSRHAGGRCAFERASGIVKFAVLASALSTAISATIGVASLVINGLASWHDARAIWLIWWMGDAAGMLVVAPLLILWTNTQAAQWPREKLWEALLLALVFIAVVVALFGATSPLSRRHYPLEFLALIPVLWAGFRFSQREVAALMFVLSGAAIAGTLRAYGPFAREDPNEALMLLQAFLASVSLCGLVVASVAGERRQLVRNMQENERHYRLIAEAASDGIVAIDGKGLITYANSAAEQIFGYSAGEMIGRELTMLMPERMRHAHKRALAGYLLAWRGRAQRSRIELPGICKDGREIALEISFGESRRNGRRLFIGIIRDVTERTLVEESRHWLASIVESTDDAIIGKTLGGIVLSWNRAAERIYGYTAAEMIGRSISVLVPPEHMNELREILDAICRGEHIRHYETERIRKDGSRIHVSLMISPIRDENGTILGASAIARDITERKRAEERIRHFAQHDALTGLPNRMLCYDRIGQAITRARRDRDQVAILFLDLDGFKQINDTQGHETGDEILRTVARRLQHCLREGDTVARLGGDEFVICLPALKDGNAAGGIAEKVLEALCAPIAIGGNQLQVTCSIGISLYPRDGEDTQKLLRAADMAMYHAKGAGRNRYQRAQ